jgi:hypothetical protein
MVLIASCTHGRNFADIIFERISIPDPRLKAKEGRGPENPLVTITA